MDDFSAVNAVYRNYFPDNFPARSCVEVSRLPLGALVEIDAMARSTRLPSY
jgi:2-iminobutanoate/2-iminopropanoate deaminase